MNAAIWQSRAWVLDVDGCLMRTTRAGGAGGQAMPGAADLISGLRAAGHDVVVCTNASQKTPEVYAEHLRSKGIPIDDVDFVSAGSAAAEYIAAHRPGARVLVVGDEGIAAPLRRLGVALAHSDEPGPADVVIVGAADHYSTKLINAACLAVEAGAPLYTTVNSPWFHGGIGKSVAASAVMAAAVGWATGTTPQVLGKPSTGLAETLVRRFGVAASDITVVGDATAEIELARLMGANSVLVLSGATTADEMAAMAMADRPELAVADVAQLFQLLYPYLTQPKEPSHE